MPRYLLQMLFIGLLATSMIAVACGDDDDDDDDGADTPTEASEDGGDNGDNGDGGDGNGDGGGSDAPSVDQPAAGTAVLALGGETYEFEIQSCGFTTEETGDINQTMAILAAGPGPDGIDARVDAHIAAVTEGHWFTITDDATNQAAVQMLLGDGDAEYQIDGRSVTLEAKMFSGDFDELGDGTFAATCE